MKTFISRFAVIVSLTVSACSSSSNPEGAVDTGSPIADGGSDTATTDTTPTDAPATDAPVTETATDTGPAPSDAAADSPPESGVTCTSARATLLGSIDAVSTGAVTHLEASGVTPFRLYVDASAGGPSGATTNPFIYLHLSDGKRVEVTDPAAVTSTGWDVALKRPNLFTNSGDIGPGGGGARFVAKEFDAVTRADATATIPVEDVFDDACTAKVDEAGYPTSTFHDWFDYDAVTHVLSPKAGTFIVRSADGKLFKLAILSYYATPDGGTAGTAGGRFLIEIASL